MGTMDPVNASVSFAQSTGPLSLEAAALETYFAGLHAGAQRQTAWWAAMAPHLPMPPQLAGALVTGQTPRPTSRSTPRAGPPTRWSCAPR